MILWTQNDAVLLWTSQAVLTSILCEYKWFTVRHMFQSKQRDKSGLLMRRCSGITNDFKTKRREKQRLEHLVVWCHIMQDEHQHCVTVSMGNLCVVVCACACVFVRVANPPWILNGIDVGQGLGLCTQRLNDRTPEGWHISQAEQNNTHTQRHSHTHTHTNRLWITQPAPSLSHNLPLERRQELGAAGPTGFKASGTLSHSGCSFG